MKINTILVIGGSGFVGKYILKNISSTGDKTVYISPSHIQLDITSLSRVNSYFTKVKPQLVINFAAITNMDESEKEREDKHARTWMVNYIGVSNLVKNCIKHRSFLIQISTDAVFPGTDQYPGPYSETDLPQKNGKDLNWYGFTKLKAEEKIMTMMKKYAIIRISHPFGNPLSERDLVNKTIRDIHKGHKLFVDQLFTPTYLQDLASAIQNIISHQICGIFHIGCRGLVPRIEFDRYLAKKLKLKNTLKVGSLKEFLSSYNRAPRTRLGGFNTEISQKKLGLSFHHWQEALDKTLALI